MYDSYFGNDENAPPKNVPLIKLYQRLCALISSLPADITTRSLTDGAGVRLNGYIDEIIGITNDNTLNDFKVESFMVTGKQHVKGETYARQLEALTNYLYKTEETIDYYCGDPPLRASGTNGAGPAIYNHVKADQQVSQSTNVHVEFNQTIINITEALTNFEHEHPDESSKENKFAKILKTSLPLAKDTLEIIGLVLRTAAQVGIDPQTVLKAMGL